MKWTTGPIVAALLLAAGTCRAESKTETDIRRSVVRILATQRFPNLLKPWMKQEPREITGTGVVLDRQRIVTNAHLVTYAKQIYVEPYQSSDKLAATVERLAPGIDLAVLKVEDKTFWKTGRPYRKPRGCPRARMPSASTAIPSAARRWPSPAAPSPALATASTLRNSGCKFRSTPPSTPATAVGRPWSRTA
ncbi:MAG TPA: trypsin-like peptidase domain-containing protein [Gemmataceae bacterium]